MDSKGQLSVEYLLLLVVIFVVFGAMITYLIGPSIDSANDISDVSATSNTINSIANAVNLVYANGPGSKRTVNVYFPQNMSLKRSGYDINATITLSNGTTIIKTAKTDYPMPGYNAVIPKGWHTVTVVWNNGENFIRPLVVL
ncbi:hypothetical protein [Methanobacterium veterum]|nr:hypothetical protein [Methanobacterium veterum]MCZ3367513.1 hypothetical protein [Methanobacterium veterum]